jgi:hypothetical protein
MGNIPDLNTGESQLKSWKLLRRPAFPLLSFRQVLIQYFSQTSTTSAQILSNSVPLIIPPPTITTDWQLDKSSWHHTQKIQINLCVFTWLVFLIVFPNNQYVSTRRRGKSVHEIPITTRKFTSSNAQNYARPFSLQTWSLVSPASSIIPSIRYSPLNIAASFSLFEIIFVSFLFWIYISLRCNFL